MQVTDVHVIVLSYDYDQLVEVLCDLLLLDNLEFLFYGLKLVVEVASFGVFNAFK